MIIHSMVPYVGCFYRYTLVKAQRAKYTASLEMRRSYCAENIAIITDEES